MLHGTDLKTVFWCEYQEFLCRRQMVLASRTYRVVRELAESSYDFYFTGKEQALYFPDSLNFYAESSVELADFLYKLGFRFIGGGTWKLAIYSQRIPSIIGNIYIKTYSETEMKSQKKAMKIYDSVKSLLQLSWAFHEEFIERLKNA